MEVEGGIKRAARRARSRSGALFWGDCGCDAIPRRTHIASCASLQRRLDIQSAISVNKAQNITMIFDNPSGVLIS